jgi:O-antigen/teichoic acid export membrane protein
VGILLAIEGYGVQALVVQQITTSVVSLLLLWLSCPWRPRLEFSLNTGSEITRFVVGLGPSGIVGILNQNCDTLLVTYFFGPGSTGLYSVAKRVKMALQQVTSAPLTGVALPALADASQDPGRLRQFFLQAVGILCLVCAPVFFGTASIARDSKPTPRAAL